MSYGTQIKLQPQTKDTSRAQTKDTAQTKFCHTVTRDTLSLRMSALPGGYGIVCGTRL